MNHVAPSRHKAQPVTGQLAMEALGKAMMADDQIINSRYDLHGQTQVTVKLRHPDQA